jgi:hypothetical protein
VHDEVVSPVFKQLVREEVPARIFGDRHGAAYQMLAPSRSDELELVEQINEIDRENIQFIRRSPAAVRPAGLGRLDVTLTAVPGRPDLAAPDPAAAALDRSTLTNDPLRAGRQREISEALHAHLRAALPAPMVPSRLVFVPDIPRTASGKADRARLPEPSASLGRAGLVPPRTEMERLLCSVWERTLGLDAVGIRDNFFAIGGDSLIWLQVSSRLDRHGVRCDLREIFDHQTVEELASAIDARPAEAGG